MKLIKLIFIIILLLSCNRNITNEEEILDLSENLIDNYPDSALFLIESINTLDNLSDDKRSRYELLKIRAKDKCYEDISLDTIIFRVRNYYLQKGDRINIALSSLYSALVLFEQGKNSNALVALLDAEKYINDIQNHQSLKGLIQSTIGHIFYRELLIDESTKRFKVAALYFAKSGEYANEAVTYNQIGLCFLMKATENDSASFYLQKGLNVSDQSKDIKLKSSIRQNIGLLWRENGELEKAIYYFKDALNYASENNIRTKIFYNIARTYIYDNKLDSAQFFIDKARVLANPESDFPILKYLNELDSKILKSQGKYKEALSLNEDFLNYMEEEYLMNEKKTILNIERKYNYELLKNNHNELLIKNQRWIIL